MHKVVIESNIERMQTDQFVYCYVIITTALIYLHHFMPENMIPVLQGVSGHSYPIFSCLPRIPIQEHVDVGLCHCETPRCIDMYTLYQPRPNLPS